MFQTQKAAKEIIQRSIDTNDRAVAKAITMIYSKQTQSEQASQMTRDHNNVGFSAFDAEILSSFAERLQSGRALTERQMAVGRKKIRRYWKQLAIMSGGLPA